MKESDVISYPFLGVSINKDIVCFTKWESGIVIISTCDDEIGGRRNNWHMTNFEPYTPTKLKVKVKEKRWIWLRDKGNGSTNYSNYMTDVYAKLNGYIEDNWYKSELFIEVLK